MKILPVTLQFIISYSVGILQNIVNVDLRHDSVCQITNRHTASNRNYLFQSSLVYFGVGREKTDLVFKLGTTAVLRFVASALADDVCYRGCGFKLTSRPDSMVCARLLAASI